MSLRTVHEHLWELGRSRRLAPDRPAEPGAMVVDPAHVLRFRARATRLDRRLPAGSWRDAAYGGLQDSAPRAALLALHARQEGTGPGSWEDPALVQVWFRWSDYVVPAADFAVFTLGVLPRDPERAAALEAIGAEVREALAGRELRTSEVRAVRPHLDRGALVWGQAVDDKNIYVPVSNIQDPAHAAELQRDAAVEGDRAARQPGAGAAGHHRDAVPGGHLDDPGRLLAVRGQDHGVGNGAGDGAVALEDPQVVRIVDDVLVADDALQQPEDRGLKRHQASGRATAAFIPAGSYRPSSAL